MANWNDHTATLKTKPFVHIRFAQVVGDVRPIKADFGLCDHVRRSRTAFREAAPILAMSAEQTGYASMS